MSIFNSSQFEYQILFSFSAAVPADHLTAEFLSMEKFLFAVIVCYAQIVSTSIFMLTKRAVNNIFVNVSVYKITGDGWEMEVF